MRIQYAAPVDDNPESTRRALMDPQQPTARILALAGRWLYDIGELLSASEIAMLEKYPVSRSPVMRARLVVARALLGSIEDLRLAAQALDATEMFDDAARVWTLLALRSEMDADGLEARRRLEVMGNQEDLQRLADRGLGRL